MFMKNMKSLYFAISSIQEVGIRAKEELEQYKERQISSTKAQELEMKMLTKEYEKQLEKLKKNKKNQPSQQTTTVKEVTRLKKQHQEELASLRNQHESAINVVRCVSDVEG